MQDSFLTESLWIVQFVIIEVIKIWPAFLITLVIAALIGGLRLDGVVRSILTKNAVLAVALAAGLGAIAPFCSCTVIPVIRALIASGVPLGPVMAIWLASPTMDPEIFTLSVATLGWQLAVVRLVATLLLALGGGYAALLLVDRGPLRGPLLRDDPAPIDACDCDECRPAPIASSADSSTGSFSIPLISISAISMDPGGAAALQPQAAAMPGWLAQAWSDLRRLDKKAVGRQILRDHWLLGRWLLLAFLLEALITRYLPQEAILSVLGQQNSFAVPLAALVGIPLYLNNIGALPVVAGLLAKGMSPGAAIAFLIAGPVTTIPCMSAILGMMRRRVFVLYLSASLIGAVGLGYLTDLIL